MIKKSVIATSIAMALGASAAHASAVNDIFGAYDFSTVAANFTMLQPGGGWTGGTNDVTMFWNGNGFNSDTDYTGPGSVSNVTAFSPSTFFGANWTAHDIQVFVPGTYSFDTSLDGGAGNGANGEAGTMTVTVGSGQLGMHMLFDWNGNGNIDVFVVAQPGSVYGAGMLNDGSTCTQPVSSGGNINCLDVQNPVTGFTPVANQVWTMATVDGNGDGVRSEERRVGKECRRLCRSRWSPYH
jgi:hypothetical protein